MKDLQHIIFAGELMTKISDLKIVAFIYPLAEIDFSYKKQAIWRT
jgi:hypothetical protein